MIIYISILSVQPGLGQKGIMRKVKKFFAEFDMFAASPTLRAKQQPQSSSLFSGILSFLLVLFFAYVFIISSVQILTYQKIQSVQTESKLSGEIVKAKQLFFAVRVGYLPAQVSMRYFEIGYYVITGSGDNITNKLQQCTQQQWIKIGETYKDQFQSYKIGEFFCPVSSSNINLEKVYYAQNSSYVIIYIRPCTEQSYCENETAQKQYIAEISGEEGAIFLLAYFLDSVIDSQSSNPISYTLNTDVQLAFTTLRGIIATVQFGSYRIQTDSSITPLEEQQILEGNFLNSFRQTSIQLKNFNDTYAMIYLGMNRRYILIKRKVGKIDEMLSYAGGLFSILIGFLAIFMNSFNQYRYELMVAEGVFHEDQQGNRIREDDLNFFKYIKYTIFDWIQTLFCVRLDWKDCQVIDDTRQQANCHLDVTRLFRKLQALESTISHVVDRDKKDCLALIKPDSLGTIKRNRLILQYYQSIVQGRQVMTIQEYILQRKILKFGLWLTRNHDDNNSNSMSNLKIENEHCIEQKSQSSESFENIEDKNQLLAAALRSFPEIERQANKVVLSEQLFEIQKQLAQEFSLLQESEREKIQERIPIMILYRLKQHINFDDLKKKEELKQESEYQFQKNQLSKELKRKRDFPLLVNFRPESR